MRVKGRGAVVLVLVLAVLQLQLGSCVWGGSRGVEDDDGSMVRGSSRCCFC